MERSGPEAVRGRRHGLPSRTKGTKAKRPDRETRPLSGIRSSGRAFRSGTSLPSFSLLLEPRGGCPSILGRIRGPS